jgi:biotin operon repressor
MKSVTISKDTDNHRVLMHLTRYGSITESSARNSCSVKRLSARIKDLRDAGYTIKTVLKKVLKRTGKITRVTDKYILEVERVVFDGCKG